MFWHVNDKDSGGVNSLGVVVPLSAAESKDASLSPLLALVASDMEKVNAQILSHAQSHVE